jgi:hypothetical protein
MSTLSRRSLLAGSTLAAGAAMLPPPAAAKSPASRNQGPGVYRHNLGEYQLTALFDGIWHLPIDDKFVRNASGAEVNDPILDRVTADRMLVHAYHFPFPACGHMAKTSTGYELVPVEWQPL